MTRRNLSQQQQKRIAKKQANYKKKFTNLDSPNDDGDKLEIGQVVVKHGQNIIINSDDRENIYCLVRKNLGDVVCGDRVLWKNTDDGQGIIEALLDRKSILSKPDQNGKDKPMAANITQLIIVLAHEPKPTGYLLDQYLISAEKIGVKSLICLNKSDLLGTEEKKIFQKKFSHYKNLGYPVIQLSAKQKHNFPDLLNFLNNEVSIFVGQSGVGKSSLINGLLPKEMIEEGEISEATRLGRHTTSFTKLYKIKNGGELIDSPGVRSFRLKKMSQSELELGYPEFRNFIGKCQFSNCSHNEEPNCAIQAAVREGNIHPERIASFLHLSI